jgi:hypothetical protein
MTHPHQAESNEADPEQQSTPAGFVKDLEEKAEEIGAATEPTESDDPPPEDEA